MEDSELVAEALGEHVFEYFIRNKRREWRDYKTHVITVGARPVPGVAVTAADRAVAGLPRPAAAAARADARPRGLPVEGSRQRVGRHAGRAGRRLGRRRRVRRRRPRGRVRHLPRAAQARQHARARAVARLGRAARRARDARGPLRRLLPLAVPPEGARGAPAPPVLADWTRRPSRDRRVRRPRAQPRDVPGRARRTARSTSRTWSTSC